MVQTAERFHEHVAAGQTAYDRLSGIYDWLGALYTGGGIGRAKESHLATIEHGQRVLYLGAGTAQECAPALRRGGHVTVVDSSAAMLRRARQRLGIEASLVKFVRGDARTLSVREPYDVVVAPFFLNVFPREQVPELIRTCASHARSGGRFVCVDFRAPARSRPLRALQKAYYLPPLALFWAVAQNAWHELYDYVSLAEESGAPLSLENRIVEKAWWLPLLETLVWKVE